MHSASKVIQNNTDLLNTVYKFNMILMRIYNFYEVAKSYDHMKRTKRTIIE